MLLSVPEEVYDDDDDNESAKKYIVLLPDTLMPSCCCEWFAQTFKSSKRDRQFSAPLDTLDDVSRDKTDKTMKDRTFQLVYYAWLIDSICADMVAPLEQYSAGDVILAHGHSSS